MNDYRFTDSQPIKEVIKDLLQFYRCDDHIYESRINLLWHKIMGNMIANHTRSLKVRQGTLSIWLDSSVLREELGYAKEKIIKIINVELKADAIKKVVLK